MPIVAQTESGEAITAFEAEDAEQKYCLTCEEEFDHIRGRYDREDGVTVSECFVHDSSSDSASCGESPEHMRMKGVAAAIADNEFPEAEVVIEGWVGSSKKADARVRFPETHERYGDGIAIEVQHKNESKDIL